MSVRYLSDVIPIGDEIVGMPTIPCHEFLVSLFCPSVPSSIRML